MESYGWNPSPEELEAASKPGITRCRVCEKSLIYKGPRSSDWYDFHYSEGGSLVAVTHKDCAQDRSEG